MTWKDEVSWDSRISISISDISIKIKDDWHAEISDDDVWIRIFGTVEYIFRSMRRTEKSESDDKNRVKWEKNVLEITMDDLEAMGVLNSRYQLLEETASLLLRHAAVGYDVVEQLATSIFEDDNDICGCRNDFVPVKAWLAAQERGG